MPPAASFGYGFNRVRRRPPTFFGRLKAVAQSQLLFGVDNEFAAYFQMGLGEQCDGLLSSGRVHYGMVSRSDANLRLTLNCVSLVVFQGAGVAFGEAEFTGFEQAAHDLAGAGLG